MKAVTVSLAAVAATVLAVGGIVLLFRTRTTAPALDATNVVATGASQVVEILAKGGYSPHTSVARAGMPTVLNVKTQGTFDCSSALNIPSLGVRKNLPPSGVTRIEVPPQPAGTTLRGVCSMGMYQFAVNFR